MSLISEIKKSGIIQYDYEGNKYFNFKGLMNNISLFSKVCDALADICCRDSIIVGVTPYTVMVAYLTQQPFAIIRTERKNEMEKKIEITQEYAHMQEIVIVEDVITTGDSVNEIAKILEENGYKIKMVLCILHVSGEIKYPVKSLFKLEDFKDNKHRLQHISDSKKSRLIVALDLRDEQKILKILGKIGQYICAVKLHYDIIDHGAVSEETGKDNVEFPADVLSFTDKLLFLKKRHNFLIIEDRKYCDIPATCIAQLKQARVDEWADIVTATGLFGVELVREIAKTGLEIILIHQTSSGDAFPEYSARVAEMAVTEKSVIGVVSQNCKKSVIGNKLIFTPGINLGKTTDGMGQKYKSESAADFIIVGRGITESEWEDLESAAIQYSKL